MQHFLSFVVVNIYRESIKILWISYHLVYSYKYCYTVPSILTISVQSLALGTISEFVSKNSFLKWKFKRNFPFL